MKSFYSPLAKNDQNTTATTRLRTVVLLLVLFTTGITARVSAADYYWVGGTGNWSDISHWATTSGGSVNHMQVPSVFDNVFFDANSFTSAGQTVTVNSGNYKCNNMNWTGAQYTPTFKNISGYNFKIYGSLTLISAMNFNFTGMISFESNSMGNTITSAGKTFPGNLYFDGNGGGWTLMDDLNLTNNTLYINCGSFNTNNKTINCGSFYSQTTALRNIDLGSSVLNLSSSFRILGTNLTLNAGTSVLNLASTGSVVSLTGNLALNNVNFTNTAGTSSLISSSGQGVFNQVTVSNNINITGNNTFNDLTLLGTNNILKEGNTQTIMNSLNAAGSCASGVYIRTAVDTIQATLLKTSGSINISNVLLKGINATGGAVFTANSSIDLGNNSGWNITNPASNTLYWVGGTGNWDNPVHWSSTSGGAGGLCIPSPFDNVVFDANSFSAPNQTVNINCLNAFCNNMTWTGVSNFPTFTGLTTSNLYIYGSLAFDPNMTMTFHGFTWFKSYTPGKTVLTASQMFGNHIYFDRPNGGWILLDDINAGGNTINLMNGSLDLNQHSMTCASFNSGGNTNRELLFQNSMITITGTSSRAWTLNGTNLLMNSSGSSIIFSAPFGGMYSTGTIDTMRYNNVTFQSPSGTATLATSGIPGKYVNVSFSSDGIFTGDNIADNLTLLGGFYILNAGKKLVVKNSLVMNGTCSSSKYLYSSAAGTQANLIKYGAAVVVDYAILKDINALGVNFTANNSVDLGNNSGWNIVNHVANTLYWVGGTGTWSDPAHWSFTSGGVPGACIPTPADNVVFDVNSYSATGQYTDINIPVAFCRNMTWMGVNFTPEFKSTLNANLNIYGSLVLSSGMNYNYTGLVIFCSETPGQSITSQGRIFKNSIYFTGIGGAWTLNDALNVSKNVEIYNGSFFTNDQQINAFNFVSTGATNRTIQLGTSKIFLNSTSPTGWNVNATNLSLSANHSDIRFTKSGGGMTNIYGDTLYFNKVFFVDTTGASTITSRSNYVKFVNVYFRNDGNINGLHTFDTLSFYPSKTYVLEANKTQKITNVLNMRGNGCFPITLRSSINGTQSSFYKSSGVVSAAYVDMRDQNAYGGASFFAGDNSVNVANNTGWIFGTSPGYIFGLPDTLYICQGDTALLDTYNFIGGVSFEWQDGSTVPVYHASQAGKYWVEVTYADHCFVADTVTVIFSQQTTAVATSDTIICSGSNITLGVNSLPGSTYLWSNSATTSTTIVSPVSSSVYFVTVSNTCGTAVDSVHVNIFPAATANAGSDTLICSGATASLHASGLPGSGFVWSNGITTAVNNVSPLTNTVYTVSVTDPNGCGVAFDQVTVNVVPLNSVEAGNDVNICQGSVAPLFATANSGVSYLWSNGTLTPGNNVSPAVTTVYTVTVTDPFGCSMASDQVTVTVETAPMVTAGADTAVCSGTGVTLTATASGATSYLWSNAASTPSTFVTPASGTLYTVTVSNGCGSTTDDVYVTVYPLPFAQAGADTTVCPGSSVTLSATGPAGSSYEWSNSVSGNLNPVNPASTTTYTVSVTDQHACGVATDQVTVNIMQPVTVDAGTDVTICNGNNTVLYASAPAGSTYLWNTSETTSSIVVSPGSTLTYTVTVTDPLGCSTDTDDIQVIVNYPPVVDAGSDTIICPGSPVHLSATGINASNYTWSTGQAAQSILVNPYITTTYQVNLSNNCGNDADQVVVMVMQPSTVSLGNDVTVCNGNGANLMASAMPGSSYLWSTGEVLPAIFVNPLSTTQYWVSVSDSLGCSTATDSILVKVAYSPTVDAGSDQTVCEGVQVAIIANASTNCSYLWSTGDTTSFIQITATNSATITVSVSNICGTASDDVILSVNPLPQIQVSALEAHCNQPDGQMSAAGGSGYLWSNGATTPVVENVPAGIYTVTVSNGTCSNSAQVTVNNTPGPVAEFNMSKDFLYVGGGDVAFYDESVGDVNYWKWSFGDGNTLENVTDPTHTYDAEGNYTVTLWVKNEFNCVDSATKNIEVQIPNTFSIPNAFTPNNDGMNDGFGPVWYREDEIVKYHIVIADRWGTIVFETQDLKSLWYGTDRSNGKVLPQGVYTWVIRYEQLINDSPVANTKAGVVTLL